MRPFYAEAYPGKTHIPSGTSKWYFTFLLQLRNFPSNPISTREKEKGSSKPQEEPHFHLLIGDERSFPCFVGKGFLAFTSHIKRRRSQ